MKHYSASALDQAKVEHGLAGFCTDEVLAAELYERARRRSLNADLLTEADVAAEVAQRLDGRNGEYGRLASDIGIAQSTLSNVLHLREGIGESVARKLGYRKVTRFERIS